MKLLSTLTVAALLASGAAFAATAASDAKPTATPAAATPASRPSLKHCERAAAAKKLTGDEKEKFVKDCRQGKKSG